MNFLLSFDKRPVRLAALNGACKDNTLPLNWHRFDRNNKTGENVFSCSTNPINDADDVIVMFPPRHSRKAQLFPRNSDGINICQRRV